MLCVSVREGVCVCVCTLTDVHGSVKGAYLASSHSQGLGQCLHWVTITPFILLLPSPMFWFLLKVLCQCPPSRVPLPCMLIELCIFYYCCQGKIRDTFSKGALRGQWTQRGVLLLLHYQSSSHLNGAGLWTFFFLSLSHSFSLSIFLSSFLSVSTLSFSPLSFSPLSFSPLSFSPLSAVMTKDSLP